MVSFRMLSILLVCAFDLVRSDPIGVSIDGSKVINPSVNRRFMGCHSDYGFEQQPRGFSANMVYGSSFEYGTMGVPAWVPRTTSGTYAALATATPFSSKQSMGVGAPSQTAADVDTGVVNRGIGGSGFAFVGGQSYDFEMFVYPDQVSMVFVELRDFTTNTSLARAEIKVVNSGPYWGSTWVQVNGSLTPSADTTCTGIGYGSDPTVDCGQTGSGSGHVCVLCGGELVVGIVGPGGVNFGYVSLMPGEWGRVAGPNGPLPVLKSAGDLMTEMGVTLIRSGGSVSQGMRWKDWRGPTWNRPSQQMTWGNSLLSGWGPFEVIDMCNALNIEPVVTLAYDLNFPSDWADLVEYCWGNSTTEWGQQRAVDGHEQPFNISVFELGNEQYNPNWVDQVAAMEARSASVGSPPLYYMFPNNGGLNAADAQRAVDMGLPVDRIMPDLHVGASGALEAAAGLFANPPVPGFNQSAINCETNAGTHDMLRALQEAADLIDFFTYDTSVSDRVYGRTASFCMGSSAQFDSWDQGIAFFLPNMTWLQPPGFVHKMIAQTWAEETLSAVVNSTAVAFAAQRTADQTQLVLRAVNNNAAGATLEVELNMSLSGNNCTVWTLSSTDIHGDNSPAAPNAISPVQSSQATSATSLSVEMPAYSFVVVVAELAV